MAKRCIGGSQPIDWSGRKFDIDKLGSLSMELEIKTVHNQLGTPGPMTSGHTKPSRTVRKLGKLSLQRSRPLNSPFSSVLKVKRGGKTIGTIERNIRTGHIHTAYSFTPDGKFVISGAEVGYLSLHKLNGDKVGDFRGSQW